MGRYTDFTTNRHCPLGRILTRPLAGQLSGTETPGTARWASDPPVGQRDTPYGRHQTPSIFQISPVRLTTYAVFPMHSSEAGRSRGSVMTANVPSPLTLTSAPVFGSAGEPGSPRTAQIPC